MHFKARSPCSAFGLFVPPPILIPRDRQQVWCTGTGLCSPPAGFCVGSDNRALYAFRVHTVTRKQALAPCWPFSEAARLFEPNSPPLNPLRSVLHISSLNSVLILSVTAKIPGTTSEGLLEIPIKPSLTTAFPIISVSCFLHSKAAPN